jgi:hypothetical protein
LGQRGHHDTQGREGNLLGFSKITRDLTARKQTEEAARRLAEEAVARRVAHEGRERLRVTLASTPTRDRILREVARPDARNRRHGRPVADDPTPGVAGRPRRVAEGLDVHHLAGAS